MNYPSLPTILLVLLGLTCCTGTSPAQAPQPVAPLTPSTSAPVSHPNQASGPFAPCREDEATACAVAESPAPAAAASGESVTESNSKAQTQPQQRVAELSPKRRYQVPTRTDDPSLGPADAPVTMVVFSDFECPYCANLRPVLAELRRRFGEKLRVLWKDLPLANHSFALPAATLAREAYVKHGNERFWQIHDELFDNQHQFSEAWFEEFARAHELTWPAPQAFVPRVQQNLHQADELGIRATPTTFINGRPVIGAQHISAYADIIHQELASGI